MANLQYGDTVNFSNVHINLFRIDGITDVVPIRFDTILENWVVCEQNKATHMLIVMNTSSGIQNAMIEIGKCENIYLLADAIVD